MAQDHSEVCQYYPLLRRWGEYLGRSFLPLSPFSFLTMNAQLMYADAVATHADVPHDVAEAAVVSSTDVRRMYAMAAATHADVPHGVASVAVGSMPDRSSMTKAQRKRFAKIGRVRAAKQIGNPLQHTAPDHDGDQDFRLAQVDRHVEAQTDKAAADEDAGAPAASTPRLRVLRLQESQEKTPLPCTIRFSLYDALSLLMILGNLL